MYNFERTIGSSVTSIVTDPDAREDNPKGKNSERARQWISSE